MTKKILSFIAICFLSLILISCNKNNQVDENKEKIDEVILAINQLPTESELVLNDENKVKNARSLYDNLDNNDKKKVTNLAKLETLERKLEVLKQEAIDKEQANRVVEMISKLPNDEALTANDETAVIKVRTAYNALSNIQKSYVTNFSELERLEEKIEKLKQQEEDKKQANQVIKLIENLPSVDALTLNDETSILETRKSYDLLTTAQKAYVTNLTKLESLEEKLEALNQEEIDKEQANQVVTLIENLPSADALTLNDETSVLETRKSYDLLTTAQKAYVTNLAKLESLEEKLIELHHPKPTEYEITFYLNGGKLENVEYEVEPVLNVTQMINYYSTGYWSNYQTEVVLFKTSLMNENDVYTSAYKLGVSYKNGKYVIDQIINDGVALSASTKTSDYFIFIHPDNVAPYNLFKTLEIGDAVDFGIDLPTTSTTSLHATIRIYDATKTQNKSYCKATYVENTILPTPTKSKYTFIGYYTNENCTGEKVTMATSSMTLYACWEENHGEVTTENVLDCVSDIVTSNTTDHLLLENEEATFRWSSSNSNLYHINGANATTSKRYQTHQNQYVTVTVEINYKNGETKTKSKQITIQPVLFEELPSTPVATYFSTGAMYAYKTYNKRYASGGALFSDTTKEALDIIYYAFVTIDANGGCRLDNTSYLNDVLELKNHNVRVVASVSGTSTADSLNFRNITADPTLRATFVNNLMNLVEKYNLDGLDIDWESASSSATVVASGMNALMKDLRAEMTVRQAANGTPYFLSCAVPASSWGTASDRFDFVTLDKYVDYINIMSYDMNKTNVTTHLSPLNISSYDKGYGFGAVYGAKRLLSLGFPQSKQIIGCAGYGKAYKVTGTVDSTSTYPALGISGSLTKIEGIDGSFASGTLFGNAIAALISTGKYTQYTEMNKSGLLVGSYLYNATDHIFVTYDSKEAVMAKYAYASSINGMGIMCWCYSEDTSDTVIDAIYEAMHS